MRLNVELFDVFIKTNNRNFISLIEINRGECLLYLEWGQGIKIQISLFFGLIKNY